MIQSEIIAAMQIGLMWGVVLTLVGVSLWFHEKSGWVIVLPIMLASLITAAFFAHVEGKR